MRGLGLEAGGGGEGATNRFENGRGGGRSYKTGGGM